MPLITKPDFTYVWASGGAIVAPNDTKKQQGWVAEAPPFQYDNWLQNRQDQMLAHINQRGIPAWDGLTNYEAGGLSYVQGSDGKIYKSVAASGPASVVSNPTTDGTDTYWTEAFASIGAFLTQPAGDTRYTQRSNNLSDVTNAATAFSNIKQSASETATGVVELATAAEAQAFTADKFIDGAKLADAFKGSNVSFAANGYQKLPSGLIIQWGITGTLAQNANIVVTLPITFPTAILNAHATYGGDPATNVTSAALAAIRTSTSQITITKGPNGGSTEDLLTTQWVAIGY